MNISNSRAGQNSAFRRYAEFTVGTQSLTKIIKFELIYTLFSALGGALGLLCRRVFYPLIFAAVGKNTHFGKNVGVRGAAKIHIGNNVSIDDNCFLDARGEEARIVIGDNVILSGGTVLRVRGGSLLIGDGCSIGRDCLLGSESRLILGKDALLAAYVYIVAGGRHGFDDPDTAIIKQAVAPSQGVEIGDGCWLGARVTVLDGATIGRGAVVGAHSLVTKSLPDMVVAHGIPARITKNRA
ncbi:MAG: hypothetical protein LBU39_00490 [Desulfobulbaceae bacterium]|jgi:acetyltransferase-like isoleucine patch superfamily enzyme|nr:hypothetical protein [Desulfobulbaceae bacterium]